MTYWAQSPELVTQHRPDTRFIWNQANDALYSEIHLSPGISTLLAILLNISGRPLTSIIGNGLQLGSAISLAHSLGLNRDSSDWDIPEAEKLLRTKIWWAIFVYDKWYVQTQTGQTNASGLMLYTGRVWRTARRRSSGAASTTFPFPQQSNYAVRHQILSTTKQRLYTWHLSLWPAFSTVT